jgi:hypothetical protein
MHQSDRAEDNRVRYEQLGAEIGRLVAEKQAAYGDSFAKAGDVLRILYPNGVTLEQLDDMLTIARVLDKLFRIATAKDAFGESPWADVTGYGLREVEKAQRRRDHAPKATDISSRYGLPKGAILLAAGYDDSGNPRAAAHPASRVPPSPLPLPPPPVLR